MIFFINNILVNLKNKGDHMYNLIVVLQVLKENKLFANIENVSFVEVGYVSLSYNV